MNEYLAAFLIGAVQGITEFLPISSDGHLVLAQRLIPGWRPPGVMFDVVLHLATLSSVIFYYRSEILKLIRGFFAGNASDLHFVAAMVIGSIPTAAIGLGFQDHFEAWFGSVTATGYFLLATAIMLWIAHRYWWLANVPHVSFFDAFLIGIFQGLAVAPGLSRSGSTIAISMVRGIDPEHAAKFSFFMAIPAILGAALLKFIQADEALPAAPVLATAVVSAAGFGLVAIRLLLGALVRGRFLPFAIYCVIVGLTAIRLG